MLTEHKDELFITQGSQVKFRLPVQLTFDDMFHLTLRFLQNKKLAKEIMSDLYVKIGLNRKKLVTIYNLKSYLLIRAKSTRLSHLGKAGYTIQNLNDSIKPILKCAAGPKPFITIKRMEDT
jgi:DNA-directed RNA polymerase specialized sigma24 family protein